MEIKYSCNKLANQTSDASQIKKSFGSMAFKVNLRLDDIKACPNLQVLMKLPKAKCQPISTNRKDGWSILVTENLRMLFKLADQDILICDNGINTIIVTEFKHF